MDHPLLNAFWIMLWFFVWVLWLMLLFRVIADLFSDHELGGFAKTIWLIGLIFLPFLGVFIYLIARGHQMQARAQKQADQSEAQFKEYVRDAAGPSSAGNADELAKLAALRDNGTLSETEFQQAKSKLLAA